MALSMGLICLLKNRQHFGELINYYGSKLKRFKRAQQHLWLLCHLTERIQLALERLTDGFIYHIRKQTRSCQHLCTTSSVPVLAVSRGLTHQNQALEASSRDSSFFEELRIPTNQTLHHYDTEIGIF